MDPDGRILDTFLDFAGVVWDIVDITTNPYDPWAWASLAADIGCIFIPGVTGGGRVIKATESISKVSKAARVVGKADDFVDAIKGGERIFGTYKDMKKVTKGFNHAIEAHHLVPQALADILEKNVDDFVTVILDKATHNGYSKEWNAVLDYIRKANNTGGIKAAKSEILKHAERIYKDAPDLLKVTQEWLKSF